MSRPLMVRLLLSLLLLVSQQLAVSHGYTHWANARPILAEQLAGADAADSQDGGVGASKSLAPDHGCAICLAAAHFGTALTSPPYRFFALECSYAAIAPALAFTVRLLSFSLYQPRAPPQA
jgi:hypothetical protein